MNEPSPKPTPYLRLFPVDVDERRVLAYLRYPMYPDKWLHVWWGDGYDHEYYETADAEMYHTYDRPGTYTITISNYGQKLRAMIWVRKGVEPKVVHEQGQKDSRYVTVTVQDDPDLQVASYFQVNWGDGEKEERVLAPPGYTFRHYYPDFKTYRLFVQDLCTLRRYRREITVTEPEYAIEWTLEHDPDVELGVTATATSPDPEKRLCVNWDDGTAINCYETGVTSMKHTYDMPEDYGPVMSYHDGSGEGKRIWITVPKPTEG